MADDTSSFVQFEIEQVDELLARYDSLLAKVQHTEPDLVELTALASVLHSFFTGMENIFATIAKRIDGVVPTGSSSHRDLLNQMARPSANRGAVLSPESTTQLAEYLAFRHFYRHAYSYFLQWTEMESLVLKMHSVWQQIRSELLMFLDNRD